MCLSSYWWWIIPSWHCQSGWLEITSCRRVISTANFDSYCKILSCIHSKPKWSQTMSGCQPGGCVNFQKKRVVEKIISCQLKRTTLNSIILNYVCPFPAPIIIAFSCCIFYFYCFKVLTAAAIILYPGLILIDHGHFQYPLNFPALYQKIFQLFFKGKELYLSV